MFLLMSQSQTKRESTYAKAKWANEYSASSYQILRVVDQHMAHAQVRQALYHTSATVMLSR